MEDSIEEVPAPLGFSIDVLCLYVCETSDYQVGKGVESQDGEIHEHDSNKFLRPYPRRFDVEEIKKEEETIGRTESDSEVQTGE